MSACPIERAHRPLMGRFGLLGKKNGTDQVAIKPAHPLWHAASRRSWRRPISFLVAFSILRQQIPVSGHRQQWPTVSVHVVLQVENFWKPRPGRLVLGPGAVRILCANEIFNSSLNALALGVIECAQAHYRP